MASCDQVDFDSETHKDDDKLNHQLLELPLPPVSYHSLEVAYFEAHSHQYCIFVVDAKVVVEIDMAVEIVKVITTNLDGVANVDVKDEEIEKMEGTARSPS